jgi:hypothetical protein
MHMYCKLAHYNNDIFNKLYFIPETASTLV